MIGVFRVINLFSNSQEFENRETVIAGKREMFYDHNKFGTLRDLETKIKSWNKEYNNLEHCGLNGKTPNEMLQLLTN